MNVSAMVALVALSEAFLHYFPWRLILRGRELPRLVAYIMGVLGLMGPFTAWLIQEGEWIIVSNLWAVILAGGISVLTLYGLDHVLSLEWKVREGIDRERLLKDEIDGQSK